MTDHDRLFKDRREERLFRREIESGDAEGARAMDYVTSWERQARKQGLREGRKEGRTKGRSEATLDLVTRLLVRRFGPSPEVLASVRALPVEALAELGEALLDFTSLADLECWLSTRP